MLMKSLRCCSAFLLLCIALTLVGCGTQSSTGSAGSTAAIAATVPQALAAPGTVSATQHPLVASYSLTVPAAGKVSVEFGPDVNYGRSTQTQTAPVGGGTLTFLVAGMHANSTYHMRARVILGSGSTLLDTDHTFTTGPLPSTAFPTVIVSPAAGLAKGAGVELVSAIEIKIGAVAYDTDGSIIWYYYDPTLPPGLFPFPIRQLDDGNYLVGLESYMREVDLAGNVVRQVTLAQVNASLAASGYSFQAQTFHHDCLRLANGHWILLLNESQNFQDLPGYPGTTSVVGDDVVDLDANNQVVWAWRAFDHLDVNRHPIFFPDWTHSNALVYTPDHNLLVSMRHQSWILKLDYADGNGQGDILWKLGAEGDFTLSVNDPDQWFYNQHFPNLLRTNGSNFSFALYDNGDARPDSSGQQCILDNTCYSRAITMNVDESARTAAVSWQYLPGFFSNWGGSIVRLPNGDLEFDSSTVNDGFSEVLEVTGGSTPQVVWQMNVTNSFFYRAQRIPSLYPGVQW
jgi:arylsulfate sulfotransferase